ncbi:MAG: ribosome maturation factor RimM [Bacteroidia bacterium]|nr:ribosome maturation factor RimM [Bacteroidia bacterium]
MIQINKSECAEVGYIQKPHGLKGEVILIFSKEFKETVEELEFLFVEVDGGLVPFFIEDEGLNLRTDESAICRLEFVDSLTKAKNLIGCKVYVFDHEIIDSEDQGTDSTLIGMRAFDAKFGDIGLISRVDDFSGNLVITVDHPRAEVMIPLSDEIITSIDEIKREIHLSCPNGLIEVYLE